MKVKKWVIISKEQAELIVRCFNPVDVLDFTDREKVHDLRRDLITMLGKIEKDQIVYEAKKRMGGAR